MKFEPSCKFAVEKFRRNFAEPAVRIRLSAPAGDPLAQRADRLADLRLAF